jgi:hypothetical protein
MSEIVITLILIGFVVGGGLFIFWPDLFSFFTRPKRMKAQKSKQQLVHSMFEEHFTKEDAFLEAINLHDRGHKYSHVRTRTLDECKSLVEERGRQMKFFLQEPHSNPHNCPMCGNPNRVRHDEMDISCGCGDGTFRNKSRKMAQELGYRLW